MHIYVYSRIILKQISGTLGVSMLINLSGPQRVEISDTLSFLRRGLLHVAH
jgi:hypothetical protein